MQAKEITCELKFNVVTYDVKEIMNRREEIFRRLKHMADCIVGDDGLTGNATFTIRGNEDD